jgi:hypothetical protein
MDGFLSRRDKDKASDKVQELNSDPIYIEKATAW